MNAVEPVVAVDAVDAEWLTAVLSAAGTLREGRVVEARREPCGTGQTADTYRFVLTYDPPGAGPDSVVGKFPSEDPTSRELGEQSSYRTEVRFYTDLAGALSVEVPTVIHAALANRETEFVLLMEDLGPARSVDQLIGCTADEAALVLERAAALHAGSWRDRELAGLDWLNGTSDIGNATDNFAEIVDEFPTLCGDLVPESDLDEARKLCAHTEAWKREFSDPQCLWHGDLRIDNVMFDAQGGARPAVLLDWQSLSFGRGTIDLAYFIATSLTTADRRAHERDLVRHYCDALLAHGVTDCGAEECWEDYALHAIYPLQVGVFALGVVKRTPRGDEMFRVWIERAAAHTRDLDSFGALAAR